MAAQSKCLCLYYYDNFYKIKLSLIQIDLLENVIVHFYLYFKDTLCLFSNNLGIINRLFQTF